MSRKLFLGAAVLVLAVAVPTLAPADAERAPALPRLEASRDPDVIERGARLVFGPAHCAACHLPEVVAAGLGPDERPPLAGGNEWDLPFGTIVSPNLTPDPVAGIGAVSDAQLVRMLRHGVRPDGRKALPFMHFERMADDDVRAVISYLRSQPAVASDPGDHRLNLLGRIVRPFVPGIEPAEAPAEAPRGVTVERGRYLVRDVAGCGGCHTQLDGFGQPVGPQLGGGVPHDVDGQPYALTPPNLTSDPAHGVTGRLDEDAFVARFRTGRLFPGSPMPWEQYRTMPDDDLRAIWRYLRTVPATTNDPGPVARPRGE